MHIVIFVDFHDSSMGGVQTSIRGQRQGLERLGHKVTIVSPPPTKPIADDLASIVVPSVPFFRPNGFPMSTPFGGNMRYVEEKLRKRGPVDIIHVQTNIGLGIMGVRIAKKWHVPLVQTMHGRDDVFAQHTYPVPLVTTKILEILHGMFIPHPHHVPKLNDTTTAHTVWKVMVNHAQAADQVVVPSHHFLTKFKEHGVTKPIAVISNGINDDTISKLPHVLKPLAKKGTPLRIMWCGRLSPEKRPLESIQAVIETEDCKMDIYGSGPLEETLRDYVKKHRLGGRVTIKGGVTQKQVLVAMQKHDILLYPSFGFDNQPMVLLEAVAAGLPIVYCDPDLTECMPTRGGLLTEGISIEAMTQAIRSLQIAPRKLQSMRKKMYDHRNKVVQSYHSKKMVTLYKRLLKHNAK